MSQPNYFAMSWDNPMFSANLSSANILDYFCNLTNPFYDRECNNEIIRMQRLNPEQLEPILYVIRKQYRRSSTEVTPMSYYYIINGTVLQAPDLSRLYNARIHTAVHSLDKCLKLLYERAKYHPADGSYSWADPNEDLSAKICDFEAGDSQQDNPNAGLYQSVRVNYLMQKWINKFPAPVVKQQMSASNPPTDTPASDSQCSKESGRTPAVQASSASAAAIPPSNRMGTAAPSHDSPAAKKPRLQS